MLEYGRIDVSKGFYFSKNDGSDDCIICYYWHFHEINFRFHSEVCDCCHNLMQKAMSFNDVAIVLVKESDHKILFQYMTKDEAIYSSKKCRFDWKKWNIKK